MANGTAAPMTTSNPMVEPLDEDLTEPVIEEMPTHTPTDILDMFLQTDNIANTLDQGELLRIGRLVVEEYEIDRESRGEWEKRMKEALDLARQLRKTKTWGGDVTANVKYPLIATACIQFQSRAYGNLVKGEDYVKVKVIGQDADDQKAQRAERIRKHLNAQLADEQVSWEDEMDTSLMALPLLGTVFKKTYRNFIDNTNNSEYVSAEDLVVHYWAKSIDKAQRITHIIEMTKNQYLEYVRSDLWRDISIQDTTPDTGEEEQTKKGYDPQDTEAKYIFLEQHRWLDLDGDGYKEPYIVTVHKVTQRVVRIVARFDSGGVIKNSDGQVIKISPVQYFTQYRFFPDFDGNFYCLGFGVLLSPVNESVNTLFNQLMDSGTLQNRQSGWVSSGVRLTSQGASGDIKFKPGEWKRIKMTADDIRKAIFPLPTHEPSTTLFQLLGLLLEASKDLASQAEVLSGEQRQPNVPATTTLALIEQGLKVFSGIYKRVHRGLKREFLKMCRLNMLYTTSEEYNRILDIPQFFFDPRLDYDLADMDVGPISSTADVSDVQALIKAQALIELSGRGLDDMEILRRYLKALQIEDYQGLFPKEPPPNPQLEMAKAEMSVKMAEVQQKERELDIREREVTIKDAETYYKMVKLQADSIKSIALAEAAEAGTQVSQYKAEVDQLKVVTQHYRDRLQYEVQKEANRNAARKQQGQGPATAAG